jgi:hypothetical protein
MLLASGRFRVKEAITCSLVGFFVTREVMMTMEYGVNKHVYRISHGLIYRHFLARLRKTNRHLSKKERSGAEIWTWAPVLGNLPTATFGASGLCYWTELPEWTEVKGLVTWTEHWSSTDTFRCLYNSTCVDVFGTEWHWHALCISTCVTSHSWPYVSSLKLNHECHFTQSLTTVCVLWHFISIPVGSFTCWGPPWRWRQYISPKR